jgi:hypothetical protein
MRSIGNPNAAPRWQRRCGFYPGSEPGERKNGTAASFEATRSAFLAAWPVSCPTGPTPIFKNGEISAIGQRGNMRCGTPANGCRHSGLTA